MPNDGTPLTAAEVTFVATEALAGIWVHNETPSGTISGTTGSDGNPTFTLANAPTGTSVIWLYVGGLLQTYGSGNDYTISSATITFNAGAIPLAGSNIRCTYRR